MYSQEKLRLELEADEGKRGRPYKDSRGYLTIGVGWNLDAHPLPEEVIDHLTDVAIHNAVATLDALEPRWTQLDDEKQLVLLNVAYNLGTVVLATFKRFRKGLGEYLDSGCTDKEALNRAADELTNSRANEQTAGRYARLATRLRA